VDWDPDTYLAEMAASRRLLDRHRRERADERVPSTVAEQLAWLRDASFDVTVTPVRADLAVFRCRKL
jgi:hypothetical protein